MLLRKWDHAQMQQNKRGWPFGSTSFILNCQFLLTILSFYVFLFHEGSCYHP